MSYGAGLLMWHCFCDEKGIPEDGRAPATQALLRSSWHTWPAAYSGKTISGYLNGVRAWHILHSLPWALEKKEMDTMLRAADKLTPNSSRKKKRCPYTPSFISAIRSHLDLRQAPRRGSLRLPHHLFLRLGKAGRVHSADPEQLQPQHARHPATPVL